MFTEYRDVNLLSTRKAELDLRCWHISSNQRAKSQMRGQKGWKVSGEESIQESCLLEKKEMSLRGRVGILLIMLRLVAANAFEKSVKRWKTKTARNCKECSEADDVRDINIEGWRRWMSVSDWILDMVSDFGRVRIGANLHNDGNWGWLWAVGWARLGRAVRRWG